MIVLDREDLNDQAGMERALRGYFAKAAVEYAGSFNVLLGAELTSCDYEKSAIVLAVEPKPWMRNPIDILHGGISATLLDMTMGMLCRYCSGGYMTPTIDLNVSYLRPGPMDRRLYIRAELTKRGMSVCHAAGALWAEGAEDRLIATAVGTYYVTKR